MPAQEITEDHYRQLKQQVEDARNEAHRAKGAVDQQMTQLKKDFDCETLKEARTLLEELEGKRDKAEEKFNKLVKDYEKKWKS